MAIARKFDDATLPCLVRRNQIYLQMLVLLTGTLKEMGGRSSTLEDKVNEILLQLAQLL